MSHQATKRPGQAARGTAGAKKVKVDPHQEQCALVQRAIAQASPAVLSSSVKDLLATLIAPCLTEVKTERHAFQNAVVDMVGRSISSITAALETDIADAKAKIEHVTSDRATRAATLAEARGTFARLTAEAAAQREAQAAAAAAQRSAKECRAAVLEAQRKVEKQADEVIQKRGRAAKAIEDLVALGETGLGDKAATKALKAVMDASKTHGVEDTLLTSVTKALKSAPSARGEFDRYALTTLQEALGKAVAGFDEALAAMDAQRGEHRAAVAAAKEKFVAASDALEAAKSAVAISKAAERDGGVAVVEAEERVASWLWDVKAVMDEYDRLVGELRELTEQVVPAYETLRELAPPPPTPPAAEEAVEEESAAVATTEGV